MPPPIKSEKSRKLDQARARSAALLNQFATPGLGSLMAGRWIAGIGQLLLAIAGFLILIFWFLRLMIHYYRLIDSPDVPADNNNWVGAAGGIIFLLAWLWSLVTSISLICEARRNHVLAAVPDAPPTHPQSSL